MAANVHTGLDAAQVLVMSMSCVLERLFRQLFRNV